MERSDNYIRSELSSAVAVARNRYSASVEDWSTVHCFFADHDTKQGPKKMQKPRLRISQQSCLPSQHLKSMENKWS